VAKQLTKAQARNRLTEAKKKIANVCFYLPMKDLPRTFFDDCTKVMKQIESLRNKL
jgi:hypothetical protein